MISSPDRNAGTGVARPPGVLPKNVHLFVLGGITLLVVLSSMFSGRKAPKVEESKATPGPTTSQLKTFQQMLEQRRRETEEAKRRLEEARTKEEQRPAERPINPGPAAPDGEELKRRARAAAAPFASSLAFRAPESVDKVELDRSSQLSLRVEKEPEPDSDIDSIQNKSGPKESGQLLKAKEGDLYRLYEGSTIKTTLVNRLDGSFTGPVITKVIEDVRSKDNTALLVPKDSVFMGKATRVDAQHQTRLAVGFNRLLMPNGYSVAIESAPALDRLGETGLKDKVNNHRFRSFGLSGAIGLLGGLALYGTQGNPFAQGVANTTGGAAISTLNQFLNAVPTITIREGHQVVVYLPKDLLLPEFRP